MLIGITVSVLLTKKLRFREVNGLACGHNNLEVELELEPSFTSLRLYNITQIQRSRVTPCWKSKTMEKCTHKSMSALDKCS